MRGTRVAGLAIVGLLLFATVGAANAVTTADRTVLDSEYVTQTLEEEGAYEGIRNATIDEVLDRMKRANLGAGQAILQAGNDTSNRTLVADAVTEAYIQEEASENIGELYAYLHGEQSELNMQIDLRPLEENLAVAFAEQVQQKDTSVLVEEFAPADSDVPIGGERVEKMQSGPAGYQEARLNFRVDVAWQVTTLNQKLVAIGKDPRRYSESEKRRIVDDRESDIRATFRQRLADNPDRITIRSETIYIQRRMNDRRAQAKAEICDQTRAELNATGGSSVCRDYWEPDGDEPPKNNVTHAAVQLQYVIVAGLTEEGYRYEEFSRDLDREEAALSNATAQLAEQRIAEEVPDSLSASDQFGQDTVNALQSARSAVGTVNLLALALPLVALALVGVAYLVTRSGETTATVTGIALAVSGALSLVVATLLGGMVLSAVEDAIEGSGAAEFSDLALALVEGVLSTLAVQSGAVLLAGALLIALAAASKHGYLDGLKARVDAVGGGDRGPQAGDTQRGQQQSPPRQSGGRSPDSGPRDGRQNDGQQGGGQQRTEPQQSGQQADGQRTAGQQSAEGPTGQGDTDER